MSKRSANKRPRKGSSNRPAASTPSSQPQNPGAWSLPTNPPSAIPSAEGSAGEADEHHDFFLTGDAGSYPEGPANASSKGDDWPEPESPAVRRTPAMDARRARNKKIVLRLVAGLAALNSVALLIWFSRRTDGTNGEVARNVRMDTHSAAAENRSAHVPIEERLIAAAAPQLAPAPVATKPEDAAPKAALPSMQPQATPPPKNVSNSDAAPKTSMTAASEKPAIVTKKPSVQRPHVAAPASAPHPSAAPVTPSGPRPTAAFPLL